jgi:hypothetical protein
MHHKPTAGFQISTLIFENELWRGSLKISHEKYINDGKALLWACDALSHLGT